MTEPKIISTIKNILKDFGDTYLTEEGVLKRKKVLEDLDAYTPMLMKALLTDPLIHDTYTEMITVDGEKIEVFKLNQFVEMFASKKYWQDSYTRFQNKIGLTADDKFIDESADVVLDFPFKDTVLKAGMTKEDQRNSKEIFLNETIAKAEIDELFEPKIFANATRYNQDDIGGKPTDYFSSDDNLIIKGNNLIALHSLKERFSGKIKLIFLDPPYNTSSDSFAYNDNFNHSSWLTFMFNRLEIARTLLSDDGMIFIQTDDNEQAYLKVLMDNVFGRDKYLNTVTVKTKSSSGASGGGEDRKLKKNTEFLTIYQNPNAKINIQQKAIPLNEYIQEKHDSGKSFAYNSVLYKHGTLTKVKEIQDGNGEKIELFDVKDYEIKSISEISKLEGIPKDEVYKKYLNDVFTTENAQTSIRTRVKEALPNDEGFTVARYVPISGRNKGKLTDVGFIGRTKRLVSFLSVTAFEEEGIIYKTEKAGTLWDDISWASVNREGGVTFENGEKPEKLLQRIIASSTQENDFVLDFFMGSATTQAVAMKMKRHFIGIEQMDYINSISIERLKKVIEGDQTGVSKELDWQGGGSFVYAELFEKNYSYLKEISHVTNENDLEKVCDSMVACEADFDFRVDIENMLSDSEYQNMSLDDKKALLVRILDKNQLYYNFSELNDENVRKLISKSDFAFNQSFYIVEGK